MRGAYMKKYYLVLVLLITISLSACSNESSVLEDKLNEFDYYTEIVDFDAEHGENIKLLAAYNDYSTEVTYIYYSTNIQSDMELIFKLGEDIIYEDFIVREYDLGEDFIGEFTGTSLELTEDIVKVNMRLVPAGMAHAEHVTFSYFYQEFNVIKSTEDIDELNRVFISTEDFVDSEVHIIEDNLINVRTRNALIITLGIGVLAYFLCLKGYKKLYSNMLQKKLRDPKTKFKLIDINIYKYVSAIVIFIVIMISNVLLVGFIQSDYNKVDFYSKYNINYEDVSSDTINITYGGTYQYDNNVAFVEKGTTHNIMGFLYITLEDGMVSVVPEPDYGGYNYKVTYKFIESDYIDVSVKEWNTDTDEPFLEVILNRRLYFDVHR